jgi:hypothetical protein
VLCSLTSLLHAQENEQVYIKGRRYLDINIHALDKYTQRLERTHKQLLNKLARKERRLERKLKRTDTAAYAKLKSSSLPSYDSISKLATHRDTSFFASKTLRSGDKAVDTLKKVYGFLQSKTGALSSSAGTVTDNAGLDNYSSKLGDLNSRLSYDQYIGQLIGQKTSNLQSIAGNNAAFSGIERDVFYAKGKISEWKKIAEEPSKAEELALEYLQGTKGFNLNTEENSSAGSAANSTTGSSMSADEMEKLGYQTKRQVMAGLQQKFGSNLGAVGASLGKDIDKWQGQTQNITSAFNETKQSVQKLRSTSKPRFKINPMKGLPFMMRIEKQYGFNTSRAAVQGNSTERPALLSLSAGAAYRQSPKLKLSLALGADIGLGKNWNNIHFSFEGLGVRSFANWEWQYGIGLYGGYERTFRLSPFRKTKGTQTGIEPSIHQKSGYSEAVVLGLTKGYKINAKWNGQIQLLYDIWWQDKGLRSPFVLRIINTK